MKPQNTEFILVEEPSPKVELIWAQDWIESNYSRSKYLEYYEKMGRDGGIEVIYRKEGFGRAYPRGLNATMMWNRIRATLFADTYWDYDIERCHQAIICYICKRDKLGKFKAIENYVKNRDLIFNKCSFSQEKISKWNEKTNQLQTKHTLLKDYVAIRTFGGGINTFLEKYNYFFNETDFEDCKELRQYFKEIKKIAELFYFLPKFEKIRLEYVEKKQAERAKSCGGKASPVPEDLHFKQGCLSIILQEEEFHIVLDFMTSLTAKGYEIGAYLYDGFLLKKGDDDELNDDIDELNRKYPYINLVKKGFKGKLKVVEPSWLKGNFSREQFKLLGGYYNCCKKYFEISNFKCLHPISYMRYYNDEWIRLSPIDFREVYSTLKVIGEKGKKISFIQQWVNDEDNRVFDRAVVQPPPLENEYERDDLFNLWEEWPILKVKLTDEDYLNFNTDRIYEHFKHIAKGEEASIKYLLDWFAFIVQRPGQKNNVMILLKGKQGTGKSIIAEELMRRIMGEERVLFTSDIDDIFGTYTDLSTKFFVVLNETTGKDTFNIYDKIKDTITRTLVQNQLKRVNKWTTKCFLNFIFTTNNFNSTKLEADDRRTVVLEVNNEIANKKEYFDNLYKDLSNKKVIRMFFDELMLRDLSNVDLINDRPETQLKRDMIGMNMPIHDKFAIWLLQEYYKKEDDEEVDDDEIRKINIFRKKPFNNKELQFAYKCFCGDEKIKTEMNTTKLGMLIGNLYGVEKERKSYGMEYTFEREKFSSYVDGINKYL